MKKLILILTIILPMSTYAQNYFQQMYNQGWQQQTKGEYYPAIKSYSSAIDLATANEQKDKAKKQIEFCAQKLEQLKNDAEKAKKKAEEALQKAEQMQRKVETAMFDKAVKEHNKEWKGYANYDWTDPSNTETQKGVEILSSIDSLDLSNNALLRLPREVSECKNLKHINLLDNLDMNWEQSDETLQELTEQTELFVSLYTLDDIAQAHWHKIKGIDLRQKITGKDKRGYNIYLPFSKIPQNLLAQQQLRWIKMNGNYGYKNTFTKIPDELFTMQQLQYLELCYSTMDTLPANVGNLTKLTSLNLYGNQLSTIPAEIGNLTNLTSLNLSGDFLDSGMLTSLPAEIGNLTNLTSLLLNNSKLTSLPAEIGNLTNLTSLHLSGGFFNPGLLTSLPSEIGNLKNLTSLNLKHHKLTVLPPEIGNLSNLTSLDLEENQLTALPPEIGNLTRLTSLDLRGNKITALPPEIGNLTNLTSLNLSSNKSTALPAEIVNLTGLTSLNLYGNQLTALPAEIENLTRLTNLDLRENQLTTLPPEIGNLKNLTNLDFGNNQITALPPEIFSLKKISASNWFEMGQQQFFDAENYKQALECYLKSIEKDNSMENKNAFSNAGSCYHLLGNNHKALEYLNKSLEFDENNVWALNQLSATYSEMKQYTKAYDSAKKLTQLEPDNYSHYFNLSFYALFAAKPQEAIHAALKSLELAPKKTGVYTNLILAYVLNNEWHKAEKIYLEWKDKHFPNDERLAKEVFLNNIEDLEKAGITHKDFVKVRKLLE